MAEEIKVKIYPLETGAPDDALVMINVEGIPYAINAREFYMLNHGQIETLTFVRRVEKYSPSDGIGRLTRVSECLEKRRELSRILSPNIFSD